MKKVLLVVIIILIITVAVCADEPAAAPQPAVQGQSGAAASVSRDLFRMNPALLSPLTVVRVPSEQFFEWLENDLQLSEDQRKKTDASRDAFLAKYEAVMKQSQEIANALRDAFRASPVDEKVAKETLTKSLKAEEELATISINYWMEFRSFLTPQQDKKLIEMMQFGMRPKTSTDKKTEAAPAAPAQAATEKPADE